MDAKAQSFDHEMDFGIKIYNKTFVYLIKRFYLYIINNRHMETIVKKKLNHDSMWITAKFPSGATYKFRVDRNGEKLEMAFSNNDAEANDQIKIFNNWLKFRPKETHADRFDRLERLTKQCTSGKMLIKLMEG